MLASRVQNLLCFLFLKYIHIIHVQIFERLSFIYFFQTTVVECEGSHVLFKAKKCETCHLSLRGNFIIHSYCIQVIAASTLMFFSFKLIIFYLLTSTSDPIKTQKSDITVSLKTSNATYFLFNPISRSTEANNADTVH